jgi:AcrR family transcriptional regulator
MEDLIRPGLRCACRCTLGTALDYPRTTTDGMKFQRKSDRTGRRSAPRRPSVAVKPDRKPHRRQLPEQRARAILMTALDLFSKRDFRSVTVRDIAAACDVNIALIYYYFDGKDELFRAAIEFAMRQALDRYHASQATSDDPAEALSRWFDVNIELAEPLKNMARTLLDYKLRSVHISAVESMIREFYVKEYALLRKLIAEGVRQRVFRQVDAGQAALFLSTHLDGIFFATMIRPELEMKTLIENLHSMLWAYLGCEPPRKELPSPALRSGRGRGG